jgi:hypothetical protein
MTVNKNLRQKLQDLTNLARIALIVGYNKCKKRPFVKCVNIAHVRTFLENNNVISVQCPVEHLVSPGHPRNMIFISFL